MGIEVELYYSGDRFDYVPTGSYQVLPLANDAELLEVRERELAEKKARRQANNKAWANQREHLTKGKKY